MFSRDTADSVLHRAAVLAVMHDPQIAVDATGLDRDARWCLEALAPADRDRLLEITRQVIKDPTAWRAPFWDALFALTATPVR